jgi:hypothetical protein
MRSWLSVIKGKWTGFHFTRKWPPTPPCGSAAASSVSITEGGEPLSIAGNDDATCGIDGNDGARPWGIITIDVARAALERRRSAKVRWRYVSLHAGEVR